MATMKAARVHEHRKPLTIDELPVPTPGPGQILVKVSHSGVCHSDLHAVDGDWPFPPKLPLIPGHEAVGHVAAAGAGVKIVKEGDRIGIPWLHTACGHCQPCRTGWETLCGQQQSTGYGVDGGHADYALADPNYVAAIPQGLESANASSVLCGGVTVYKGLKQTEARPGQWVAILGVGGLGHYAVQYAKAMGMHVIAFDIAPQAIELANQLGADLSLNAADPTAMGAALQATEGQGPHATLVTATSPKAFLQGMMLTRRGGTMVVVGMPPGEVPIQPVMVVAKAITIRGSVIGTRQDLAEALQFAAEGKVKTHYTLDKLENINAIFDRMRQGTIEGRVVLAL